MRPAGVTAISLLFGVAAIYLWTVGLVKLAAPNAISLTSGAPLMYGLELAGPYMALLVGGTVGVEVVLRHAGSLVWRPLRLHPV